MRASLATAPVSTGETHREGSPEHSPRESGGWAGDSAGLHPVPAGRPPSASGPVSEIHRTDPRPRGPEGPFSFGNCSFHACGRVHVHNLQAGSGLTLPKYVTGMLWTELCVPRFLCRNPDPQCGGVGAWGADELTGVEPSRRRWRPDEKGLLPLSLPREGTQEGACPHTRRRVLNLQPPDLRRPASRAVRNKFRGLSPAVYGILVMAARTD